MEKSKEILLTAQGLQKIKDELDYLKTNKRDELSEKIALALSYGDLSENSEYDDAKNEQAQVEARIADLEVTLQRARIIDENEMSNEHIHIGSFVTFFNETTGSEMAYRIVSSSEADPIQKMISNESPIGSALIDKSVGDVVSVDLPNGNQITLRVVSISK